MDYKEYYQNLTDEELINYTINKSNGIKPEAYIHLYEAVSSRRLLHVLREKNIELKRPITDEELEELYIKNMASDCPLCKKNKPINAIKLRRAKGLIFLTVFEKYVIIGCHSCIKKEVNTANSHNIIFGWWSVKGLLTTPFNILSNYIKYKKLDFKIPSKCFKAYIKLIKT